jgi:hypothetical protein
MNAIFYIGMRHDTANRDGNPGADANGNPNGDGNGNPNANQVANPADDR